MRYMDICKANQMPRDGFLFYYYFIYFYSPHDKLLASMRGERRAIHPYKPQRLIACIDYFMFNAGRGKHQNTRSQCTALFSNPSFTCTGKKIHGFLFHFMDVGRGSAARCHGMFTKSISSRSQLFFSQKQARTTSMRFYYGGYIINAYKILQTGYLQYVQL